MKYALVDGLRVEPTPKNRGICPGCGAPVTSKCGMHVLWHWAHLRTSHCDKWWESETQWHRDWKNRFPLEWQEVVLQNPQTGERHIADVRTEHGLVIEFQRSTITPEEVTAREAYYQKMVWVIDGCRSKNDPIYFNLGREPVSPDGFAKFYVIGRTKLFHRWHTNKPVFIDFGNHGFWRIVQFNPINKSGVAALVDRDAFTDISSSGKTDISAIGGPTTQFPSEKD